MKYSVHDYAKALAAVIRDPATKPEVATKHFLALIRRNGDEMQLSKIVKEAARLAGGVREVVVASARPLSKTQQQLVKNFLKPSDRVQYEIDPGLVAGVKIVVNDEMQLDGTLKAKLDKLFGAQLS